MNERIVLVVPIIGSGTESDPQRPLFVPAPGQQQKDSPIRGFSWVLADDGKRAIVEFVGIDRSALLKALSFDSLPAVAKARIIATDLGEKLSPMDLGAAEVEQRLQGVKKNFRLSQLRTVIH